MFNDSQAWCPWGWGSWTKFNCTSPRGDLKKAATRSVVTFLHPVAARPTTPHPHPTPYPKSLPSIIASLSVIEWHPKWESGNSIFTFHRREKLTFQSPCFHIDFSYSDRVCMQTSVWPRSLPASIRASSDKGVRQGRRYNTKCSTSK